MNRFLWVLQVLLAMHTLIGAIWKFSHAAEAMPTLQVIPQGVWMALVAIEILAVVALLLPAWNRKFAPLAPLGALVIAVEMIAFIMIHVSTGSSSHNEPIYWLVTAALCTTLAGGRFYQLRKASAK